MNKKLYIFPLVSFFTTSCFGGNTKVSGAVQCKDQDAEYKAFKACDLEDLKQWYNPVVGNPETSDKVILWWVGGPQPKSPIDFILKKELVKKNFPNMSKQFEMVEENKISYVLLDQVQWKKRKTFDNNYKNFNLDDALLENMETIDMAHKIVKYFKDKGKKVMLGGDSFGGFLTNLYLSKYGDDLPDAVLSQSARLKQQNKEELISIVNRGDTTFYVGENDKVIDKETMSLPPEKDRTVEMKSLLAYSKFFFRSIWLDYTINITDKDLSKTRFLSAKPDQHVGWFNQEEINWAKGRKAQVEVFEESETLKYFNKYKENWGVDFKHTMGNTIKTFAHMVGSWDAAQIQKYFIDPLK